MEKILTMLVGLLIALGGWSLSRTFELSTSQAVLEDKVERLEMQVRLMDEKMDEMFDMDDSIHGGPSLNSDCGLFISSLSNCSGVNLFLSYKS